MHVSYTIIHTIYMHMFTYTVMCTPTHIHTEQSDGLINWVEIGEVTTNGTGFVFTGETQQTVWPGIRGYIPYYVIMLQLWFIN